MIKVKTVVIGCGAISDTYLNNLKTGFTIIDLAACSDLNIGRMNEKAEKYGLKAMTLEEIIADQTIELVVNLTNPAAHYSINKALLMAGKHVYSEKLMCNTIEQAEELRRIAEEKKLHFGVAPDTFLGGTIQTARLLIDKGMIGRPLSFVASLTRDYEIFGDILPHFRKPGGSLASDTGCYYLTALASLFGPAKKVGAIAVTNEPRRTDHRISNSDFGKTYVVEVENILTAAIEYQNGVLGTFHINSDCIFNETRILRIFGTEGILSIEDPNRFGSRLTLQKAFGEEQEFSSTHGFNQECRGIGAAEMAWAIRYGRKHRASLEMGYHILEMLEGMIESSNTERFYYTKSSFEKPEPLPAGYVARPEYGMWAPTEETALAGLEGERGDGDQIFE